MSTWILERFPRYARFVLWAAIAGTPAVFTPNTLDIFNLAKLTLLWIAALTAGWLWFAWSLERRAWLPRFNLGYAAGAFLAAYFLATLFSHNRATSVLGLYHRYGGFVPVVIYALIALGIVALYWEHPAGLRSIPVAVLAGSVPVSIYTLIQVAGFDWIDWGTPGGGPPEFPGSTLGNSNFLGGYLGIALPFVTYLAFTVKHWVLRALIGVAFAAAAAALWFSGSRGGIMAAGGGLICMAFLFRQRLAGWLRAGIVVLVLCGVALAVLIVWHPGMQAPPGPLQDLNVFRTGTFRLRSHYWAAAWRIFLDNPLLGTGPDTFKENYRTYHLTLSASDLASGVPDKPHNIFLEYAASSGLVGLGTYVTFIALTLKYALKRVRSQDGTERALLSAFTGGLVAYLIQGFFSLDVAPLALMAWISLGSLAVLADPRLVAERAAKAAGGDKKTLSRRRQLKGAFAEPDAEAEDPGQVRRRAIQTAGAVVALAAMALGARPLLADATARSGLLGSTPLPQALARLETVTQLHPWESTYLTMAATRVFRHARLSPPGSEQEVFRQGHSWLAEKGRRSPGSMFVAMNLARVNEFWGLHYDPARFQVADRWWRTAVAIDPYNWRLSFKYGAFLGDWALKTKDPGAKRKTVSVLEQLGEVKPEEPEVWLALGKSYVLNNDRARAQIAFRHALAIRPEYQEARIWLKRVSPAARSDREP